MPAGLRPKKPEGEPRKAPTSYSAELADRICDAVMAGSNLSQLERLDWCANRKAIYGWLDLYPDFKARYEEAKKRRAEWRVDQLDAIAKDLRDGKIDYQTARFLMDKIKWQSGKEDYAAYGDKVQQEISAPGGKPFTVVISSVLDRETETALDSTNDKK